MRKKALGIIGGVVLVAALGTASFFLLRNAPEEDSSSCLLYTSPSPRDYAASRMPSSA